MRLLIEDGRGMGVGRELAGDRISNPSFPVPTRSNTHSVARFISPKPFFFSTRFGILSLIVLVTRTYGAFFVRTIILFTVTLVASRNRVYHDRPTTLLCVILDGFGGVG